MPDREAGPRRSARKRTFTQRYVESDLIELEDADLQPSPVRDGATELDQNSSDEYRAEQRDDHSAVGDNASISSNDNPNEHEVAESESSDHSSSQHQANLLSSTPRKRRTGRPIVPESPTSRRLMPLHKAFAKDYALFYVYPKLPADRQPLLKAIHRWSADMAMPSRLPDGQGVGGYHLSYFITDHPQRSINDSTTSFWSFDKGWRQKFELHSTYANLQESQATPYMSHYQPPAAVLLGQPAQLSLHHLKPHEPFLHANGSSAASPEHQSTTHPNKNWLINIGQPIQCLEWAPKTGHSNQYLAVSTWPTDLAAMTSAFTPSEGFRASIQIWEFSSTPMEDTRPLTLSYEQPPQLRCVLCVDWGLVKTMKWCPMPYDLHETKDNVHIGLLAAIFTDGAIRILDVRIPHASNASTQYIHYTSMAFEAKPPDTVCTCLTWISSSVLAAGCANGFVAIWDIASHLSAVTFVSNAVPCFYQALHLTFVTAISSCQPSRPSFVLTTSMDGFVRLTDLRHPAADSIYSARSRLGTCSLLWHEQTQHAICTDESQYLRCHNVRSFFRSYRTCEVEATVLALAASPVHPCVLIGTADGSVTCTNPLRSLMESRRVSRGRYYRRKWITHEWRRGRPQPDDAATGDQSLDFPNGLSRIMTDHPLSFRPSDPAWANHQPGGEHSTQHETQQKTNKHGGGLNVLPESRYGPSGVAFTTLHEEQAAAKCVAWHPDIQCGGWAAAGLGSGILVVSDIAVDR